MDNFSNFLACLRNAQDRRLPSLQVKFSNFLQEVVKVLEAEGYISSYSKVQQKNISFLEVSLKYYDDFPVIQEIKQVSKPGCRRYVKARDISNVYNGLGVGVFSSSQGVYADREMKRLNLGGEYLFYLA